jgi:hypothetical protein
MKAAVVQAVRCDVLALSDVIRDLLVLLVSWWEETYRSLSQTLSLDTTLQ